MKKLIIIITLFFSGITIVQSQVLITLLLGDKLNSDVLEFGLEGGINWTKISGMDTRDYARKWNLGFYFDIKMKNQWYIYTGVLVKSNMGVDNLTTKDLNDIGSSKYNDLDGIPLTGDYKQKLNCFLVPVLAKYKFKNHMYVELGPQFGLTYKAWVEFESDIDGKDAIIREYNTKAVNKIDAGIVIGTGFTLFKGTGWTFGAKYYYGFIDVYKNISNTKNSSIFIKVNIPIGAGKKSD